MGDAVGTLGDAVGETEGEIVGPITVPPIEPQAQPTSAYRPQSAEESCKAQAAASGEEVVGELSERRNDQLYRQVHERDERGIHELLNGPRLDHHKNADELILTSKVPE